MSCAQNLSGESRSTSLDAAGLLVVSEFFRMGRWGRQPDRCKDSSDLEFVSGPAVLLSEP